MSIATNDALSHEEIRRYSRHLLMPEVGLRGQQKLKAASVLLIGAGGLGSPAGLYLAAAGVGRLGIVDFDVVDESNLQRQIMHGTSRVGQSKLVSAKARLEDLNPDVTIETYETSLTSQNALEILQQYDLIVDGTDNFPTRYLVNDACVMLGKPLVYGSIFRFEGQATVFDAQAGPCYRCLYPDPPPPGLVPSCAEGGVFGVLPGLIGVIQATEAVKLIIGQGESLIGRLLLYDALSMRFQTLRIRKQPDCPMCGDTPRIHALIDYEAFCGLRRPEAASDQMQEMTPQQLHEILAQPAPSIRLIDVREPHEWEIAHLEGATLIPLGELHAHLSQLDANADYVVYCKSGGRSAQATRLLQTAGFHVKNLSGGINAWSREVDPAIPIY